MRQDGRVSRREQPASVSARPDANFIWSTANRLGYSGVFVNMPTAIDDDHQSFGTRNVKTVDIIDLEIPYWHTPHDTLDKISSKSLAVVGHVILETVKQLQTK